MARPLTRTHRLELRLSDEDHTALRRLAAGQPLGPTLVRAALRPDGAPQPVVPVMDPWPAVEALVDRLRGLPMHRQAVTALAQLRQALR